MYMFTTYTNKIYDKKKRCIVYILAIYLKKYTFLIFEHLTKMLSMAYIQVQITLIYT